MVLKVLFGKGFLGVPFSCCIFSTNFKFQQAMDDLKKKMTNLVFNILFFALKGYSKLYDSYSGRFKTMC